MVSGVSDAGGWDREKGDQEKMPDMTKVLTNVGAIQSRHRKF